MSEHECTECGSDMALKNGRNGKFWGCSSYPDCDNTFDATPEEIEAEAKRVRREKGVKEKPVTKANKGLAHGAKATGKVIANAMVEAGSKQLAAKTAEGLVLLARHHLGQHWPAALDTPVGRKVAQAAVPVAVLFLCEAFGESIPLAAQARGAAELAVRGTTDEAAKEAIEVLAPFLQSLVQLGAGTPITALIGDGDTSEREAFQAGFKRGLAERNE